MKNCFNLFVFVLLVFASIGTDTATAMARTIVVSGKVTSEEGTAVSNISITVCESKAGFLAMREKVLSSVKLNADGTFKTPALRHRSSWQLIVRVDGGGNGLEYRTVGFDPHALDRSKRYAAGQVYLDTSLKKRQGLRK